MKHLVFLYVACILAGWALLHIPATGFLTVQVLAFFQIIGALAILVFALVIIYLGIKSLLAK